MSSSERALRENVTGCLWSSFTYLLLSSQHGKYAAATSHQLLSLVGCDWPAIEHVVLWLVRRRSWLWRSVCAILDFTLAHRLYFALYVSALGLACYCQVNWSSLKRLCRLYTCDTTCHLSLSINKSRLIWRQRVILLLLSWRARQALPIRVGQILVAIAHTIINQCSFMCWSM